MKTSRWLPFVVIAHFTAFAALADESPVYEHLKDLECFVGNWEGQSTVPESQAHSASAKVWENKPLLLRMNTSWAPGNNALISHTVFQVPGEVTITGTILWGWDPNEKNFKATLFTSHKGFWSDVIQKKEDGFVSNYTGTNLDGAACTGTTTYTFPDDNTMVVSESNRTCDGKPLPDVSCKYSRVTSSSPSHYDKLKDFEALVGQWEARKENGGSYHWIVEWTQDKNFLNNVITGRDSAGNVTMSNKGYFGWDPKYRRITNWCVDIHGNQPIFLWEKQADGTWHTWSPHSGYVGTVTFLDDGTWRMEGGGESLHFKRVSN